VITGLNFHNPEPLDQERLSFYPRGGTQGSAKNVKPVVKAVGFKFDRGKHSQEKNQIGAYTEQASKFIRS